MWKITEGPSSPTEEESLQLRLTFTTLLEDKWAELRVTNGGAYLIPGKTTSKLLPRTAATRQISLRDRALTVIDA